MAPPRSVYGPPSRKAGDKGPFPERAGLQASSKLDLPVPPMGKPKPTSTYGGNPALALKVMTFLGGIFGGNVRDRLNFDKGYHASPQLCSEEHSPTTTGGRYKNKGRIAKAVTRTWSAVLRLDFWSRKAHESGRSHDQQNWVLKVAGGYRSIYNLTIELLRDAGYGAGKKGSVAPFIDPAMKRVISDCVTVDGSNSKMGRPPKERKIEEVVKAKADYEAARARLNSRRTDAGKAAIDTPVGWFLVHNPKLEGLPGRVRQLAYEEALQAYESNRAKQQKAQRDKKTPQKFKLNFKRASDLSSWTVPIDKKSITNVKVFSPDNAAAQHSNFTSFEMFPTFVGEGNQTFVISGKMPSQIKDYEREIRECRIVAERLGSKPRFRLIMPYNLLRTQLPKPKPKAQREVAAVDPGQRTLGTVYTPRGCLYDACGSDDPDKGTGKLKAHLKRESAAKARRRKLKRKHRLEKARRDGGAAAKAQLKELSKRLQRAHQAVERRTARVRGWVTQMHRAYAHWLLSEFDTVIYPYFGTQSMVRKSGKLHPAVKKILMRQRHYKLRRYIEDRARTLGKEVVFVTEYYTTMTCGVCGRCNYNVGGAKVFKCVNETCGITMPRDGNGARNIMLQLYVV